MKWHGATLGRTVNDTSGQIFAGLIGHLHNLAAESLVVMAELPLLRLLGVRIQVVRNPVVAQPAVGKAVAGQCH